MDNEKNVVLRKRTPVRARSISPPKEESTTKTDEVANSSWDDTSAPMYRFQQNMKMLFPEIQFNEEFSENQTTMCQISGITCPLSDLNEINKDPSFTFSFEDGTLCLTYRKITLQSKVTESPLTKKIAIIILWILNIFLCYYVITILNGKYNLM